MDFNKLASLLTEAPIGEFQLKGKWGEKDPLHGYDKASAKLLTNPKYVEKIKSNWNKSDFQFDLYFLKDKNLRQYSERGRVDYEFVRTKLNLDIEPNEDAITIIYINNAGDEKVPLTSWILAHRLGHAMARDSVKNRPSYYSRESDSSASRHQYDELQREIDRLIDEIAKEVYSTSIKPASIYGVGNGYDIQNNTRKERVKKKIAEALGTFKSARDGNLRQTFEMTNELIAQYITAGKITFNKSLPRHIPLKNFYKTTTDAIYKQKNITPEDEKDIIEGGEEVINYQISNLLGACINSIFVM